jgi:excisionase family DNA binding protein
MRNARTPVATPPRAARASAAQAANGTVEESSEALTLLTADQVGAMFGVRGKHVLTMARDNGLPHVRLGRYVRFKAAAVESWLAEQEAKSHA